MDISYRLYIPPGLSLFFPPNPILSSTVLRHLAMMPSRGVITHKMIPVIMATICFMGLTILFSIWSLNCHDTINELIISFGDSDGLFLQQSNKETLRFDFYREECPEAEMIVWASVNRVMAEETRAPAQLLRLMFHDCFIQVF